MNLRLGRTLTRVSRDFEAFNAGAFRPVSAAVGAVFGHADALQCCRVVVGNAVRLSESLWPAGRRA